MLLVFLLSLFAQILNSAMFLKSNSITERCEKTKIQSSPLCSKTNLSLELVPKGDNAEEISRSTLDRHAKVLLLYYF